MTTVSNIRRLTDAGRAIIGRDRTINPSTAIELVRIFDQIDVELVALAGAAPPAHRARRVWRGLWRRNGGTS